MEGGETVTGEERATEGSNIEFHIEVAKSSIFNREAGKIGGFITGYKLYLRMQM